MLVQAFHCCWSAFSNDRGTSHLKQKQGSYIMIIITIVSIIIICCCCFSCYHRRFMTLSSIIFIDWFWQLVNRVFSNTDFKIEENIESLIHTNWAEIGGHLISIGGRSQVFGGVKNGVSMKSLFLDQEWLLIRRARTFIYAKQAYSTFSKKHKRKKGWGGENRYQKVEYQEIITSRQAVTKMETQDQGKPKQQKILLPAI